ncbi:MAG: M28 family peptidase [Acidimicrobiia bacterium]|nr:M28 family peptidase [Acidimicrobiia bacterium]
MPPFSVALMQTMQPALEAGAIGFVGVLRGYPGGGCEYYVPYDGAFRPIPGVYVGEDDGDRLAALLMSASHNGGGAEAHATVPIRLRVDAERGSVMTNNVVGELPGADDELVVIGSHHDGPWASAVEDASGIALVLAQAEYWSRVPEAERPHRLVFTVNAAHMAGGRGTEAFCESHADALESIVLEMHLEHAARECIERDGALEVLDVPVPRWWFTSESPDLERAVWDAVVAEDMDRSLILTPTALGERPTTDGGHFHLCGVPIVNYLTAPWYLFDASDTMDKIHDASLEPLTRAAVRIVEWTAGRSAASVRAGVRYQEEEAPSFDEAVRSLLSGDPRPLSLRARNAGCSCRRARPRLSPAVKYGPGRASGRALVYGRRPKNAASLSGAAASPTISTSGPKRTGVRAPSSTHMRADASAASARPASIVRSNPVALARSQPWVSTSRNANPTSWIPSI